MDEIKLKCDIHVSVVLLCMVILKVCENNHGINQKALQL